MNKDIEFIKITIHTTKYLQEYRRQLSVNKKELADLKKSNTEEKLIIIFNDKIEKYTNLVTEYEEKLKCLQGECKHDMGYIEHMCWCNYPHKYCALCDKSLDDSPLIKI